MMTDHPCKGLPAKTVEVFEQIAIGEIVPTTKTHVGKLLKLGLIEDAGQRPICKDRFGTVCAPQYEVPIPIHMQWCKWASEQNGAEGE